MMRLIARLLLCQLSLALAPSGCGRGDTSDDARGHAQRNAPTSTPSNRVDIPASVRENLGITFARVESRMVTRTLRVPGRFELLPTARREYRVPAQGRIELLVNQFDRVSAGTPLYRLDSPRVRELQRELIDAESAVESARADSDSIEPFFVAHEKHHAEVQSAVDVWTARVAALERLHAAGGVGGDEVTQARAALASARAAFAETLEKEADLLSRRRGAETRLRASQSRLEFLLASFATLTGLDADQLASVSDGVARWKHISRIEVLAHTPGIVESLHAVDGAVLESGESVVTTVQPQSLHFRAHALQSDLGSLSDGLACRVTPPQGGSLDTAPSIEGVLTLSPTADPQRRTLEVIMTPRQDLPLPHWARAGVSAFLEIITPPKLPTGSDQSELAIPLRCVARDGTRAIIFRRDPANPDVAIRLDADLGQDDGRWVVIKSGVAEGNEIVLDGVYQLMVATSGSITKGGHFHSDGTFHEGED